MSGPDQESTASPSQPAQWCEQLKIHSYDVDLNKRATPEALCRYFLEAAWNHAEKLGFGYARLASENQFWVLARLLVQFDVYPSWGDNVVLSTWPRGGSGVLAWRDFEICDSAAKRLVAGASSWLVLDATTRRPQRLDKLLFSVPAQVTRQATGREPKKLTNATRGQPGPAATVHYSDIDVNGHVNSARYISWLLDSYSAAFHQHHALHRLELNYVGETLWGEAVSVATHSLNASEFAHTIAKSDGVEVCRAELSWGPAPAPTKQ